MDTRHFSKANALKYIFIYFLLFLAGDLLSSLLFDLLFSAVELPVRQLYPILRMSGCLLLTYLLFWLYTAKGLRMRMEDFGITCSVQKWGILLAVLLPLFVVSVYLLIGDTAVNAVPFGEALLIAAASLAIGAKSGILEEMLFRGYMMRLLESGWNRRFAILVPSVVFGLLHIPSMDTFSIAGVLLLTLSGTLVGIMFSIAAYRGNSIGNSALLHGVWNAVMITDLLHITTAQDVYGSPLVSITIPSDSIFLTGGGFGVEASAVSIAGYLLVCGFILFMSRKNPAE